MTEQQTKTQEMTRALAMLLIDNIKDYLAKEITYRTLCTRQSNVWTQAKKKGVFQDLANLFAPQLTEQESPLSLEEMALQVAGERVTQLTQPIAGYTKSSWPEINIDLSGPTNAVGCGEYPVYVPQSKQPLLPRESAGKEHPEE